MAVHLLGIRHHGPGSSRHVLDALEAIKPDIILIEGPPEGEAMAPWVGHADMKPPVALLAYVPDNPQRAVFYPFTTFSPEWNAIKYGLENHRPIRFIDMPLMHSLAETTDQAEEGPPTTPEHIRKNPIGYLAEIAGFEDAEEWWEQQFEIAHHSTGVFDAIAASMAALRENLPARPDRHETLREAFMRRGIRAAQREMYTEIAVICGAWHVPALQAMPKQKDDDALLKNLPKVKIETTWIPWTNDRLSFESGYGAGLESPGWYDHAWNYPDDRGELWFSKTARVFRQQQVDISSAHIIESVRLAHALAGLRQLARPGLKEYTESTLAVMCMGDPIFMRLIHRELIVGRQLGEVPENTPQAPIQKDLEQHIRKLRLKISQDEKVIKLDLREETDLQRSILFHRLHALDVPWAKIQHSSGKGTFKEEWNVCWYPELTVSLLEKAPFGNTVEAAASQYLERAAVSCTQLEDITKLVEKTLPAALPSAIHASMKRLDELAAGTSDIPMLMHAFIPLVQVSRYGNVRKTDLDTVGVILTAIFYRITAGLPLSCTGIDDDQANSLSEVLKSVHQSVLLLENEELRSAWMATLQQVITLHTAAPLIQGYCCKNLYDARVLDSEATAVEFSKALSVNNAPNFSANWLEGFLKDAATVLILDDAIWNIVHDWLLGLEETVFLQVIPLLRRTFAIYSPAEKRKIANRASHGSVAKMQTTRAGIDPERAAQVIPILKTLMGL